jgi:hypothetical protein
VRRLPQILELATSNFSLFRPMKGALLRKHFTGPAGLFNGIQSFLNEIHSSELEHLFRHWINRVRWVMENEGDYFHEYTLHPDHVSQFCSRLPVTIAY